MAGYFQLLRHKRFSILMAGQIVSLLADALFPMLVVTAVAQHATGFSIATIFAVRATALGALVLFAGGVIDRINPVVAAVVADSVRAAALVVFALTWDGTLGLGVVALAALIGACESISEPALLVIAPTVAESDSETGRVYALLDVIRHGATVLGPVLAAGIATALGVGSGAALAAGLFAASAVATRIAGAKVSSSSAEASDDEDDGSLVREAFSGLKLLWNIRWVRVVQLISVLHVVLAVGPWTVILPVVILRRSDATGSYGLLLSAFALGAVGGALLGGRIRGAHRGVWAMLLLSLFGFTVMTPGLTGFMPVLLIAFVAGGVGQEACDVVKMAAMREQIPESYRGRAFAADFFFSFAALPIGQVLGAVLIRDFDGPAILIFAGVTVLATSLLSLAVSDMRRFSSPLPSRAGEGVQV